MDLNQPTDLYAKIFACTLDFGGDPYSVYYKESYIINIVWTFLILR